MQHISNLFFKSATKRSFQHERRGTDPWVLSQLACGAASSQHAKLRDVWLNSWFSIKPIYLRISYCALGEFHIHVVAGTNASEWTLVRQALKTKYQKPRAGKWVAAHVKCFSRLSALTLFLICEVNTWECSWPLPSKLTSIYFDICMMIVLRGAETLFWMAWQVQHIADINILMLLVELLLLTTLEIVLVTVVPRRVD